MLNLIDKTFESIINPLAVFLFGYKTQPFWNGLWRMGLFFGISAMCVDELGRGIRYAYAYHLTFWCGACN
jgi:hypothetical protein